MESFKMGHGPRDSAAQRVALLTTGRIEISRRTLGEGLPTMIKMVDNKVPKSFRASRSLPK
jgi:hypothetical protein